VLWKMTDDTVRTSQWVFLWIVSSAGFLSLWLSGRLRAMANSPILAPLACVGVAAIVLPAFAFRVPAAAADSLGILSGLAVAAMSVVLLRERRNLRASVSILTVSALMVASYAFLQYVGADVFRWAYSYGGQRPFATLGNPNFLAGHFAVLLPIAVGMLILSESAGSGLFWGCVSFAWGMVVVVTQTRSAWLATGVSLGWLFWWSWRRKPAVIAAARNRLVALGAVFLAVGFLASLRNPDLLSRFVSLSHPDLGQFAKRSASLRAAMFIWREDPLVGMGPGNFRHGFGKFMGRAMPEGEMAQFTHTYSEEYVHSDPAQFLCEYGTVGGGLMLWLVVCAAAALAARAKRGDALAACLMASGLAFAVHATFNLPLHIAPTAFIFWAIVGVAGRPFGRAGEERGRGEAGAVPGGRKLLAAAVFLGVGVSGALLFASSVYSRFGKDYLSVSMWNESLDAFGKGMKINWDDRRERFFAASVEFQLGRPEEAVDLFREEIRRNPYFMDGFANLGSALGMMGQIEEAEAMLKRAIGLNPAYAEAWANLGVAMLVAKRHGEAAGAFRRALSLEPTLELAQNGLREALAAGGGGGF